MWTSEQADKQAKMFIFKITINVTHFFRWFALFSQFHEPHSITFIRHIFTYICLCLRVSTIISIVDSISENKAQTTQHIILLLSLWIRFRFYSILCVMEYQICIKISIVFFCFYRKVFSLIFFDEKFLPVTEKKAEHFAILLWYVYVLYDFAVDVAAFQCQSILNGLPIACIHTLILYLYWVATLSWTPLELYKYWITFAKKNCFPYNFPGKFFFLKKEKEKKLAISV